VIDAYEAPYWKQQDTLRLYDSKGSPRRFDLPQVCKQIYIESRPLLFKGATLRIGRLHGLESFSSCVRASDLNAIQPVRITIKMAEILTYYNDLQSSYESLHPQVRRVLCLLIPRTLGGVKSVVLESRPLQESGDDCLSTHALITGVWCCIGDRSGLVGIVYGADD
jgi:hypothetical protein